MRECVGDHAIALSDQRNHEIGEKKNALYRTTWFGQILRKSEMASERKKNYKIQIITKKKRKATVPTGSSPPKILHRQQEKKM